MTKDDFTKLLKAAPEGSRELDCEVALCLGWTEIEAWIVPIYFIWREGYWLDPDGNKAPLPHFTTSLDDAIAMMPEGWITFKAMEFPINSGHPLKGKWLWKMGVFGSMKMAEGIGQTPALAIIIAILAARGTET